MESPTPRPLPLPARVRAAGAAATAAAHRLARVRAAGATHRPARGRGTGDRAAAAGAVLALLAGAPAALAQQSTGGAEPTGVAGGDEAQAAPAPIPPPLRPVIEGVTCRTACTGIVRATAGSVVRVSGDGVERASALVLLGGRGARDDVVAATTAIGPGAVQAVVPDRARSGRLRLVLPDGTRSRRSRQRLEVGDRAAQHGPDLESRSDTRWVFQAGARRASVSFFARRSVPVSVDLVRADGIVVAQWDLRPREAGSVQTVEWDGRAAGAPAPEGRYVWRVAAATAPDAAARSARAGARGTDAEGAGGASSRAATRPAGPSFVLLSHRFPVAGTHAYGDGLGAGRGHEGVDVFATCGTPVVAAIAGEVRHVAFHSRAGHYLVVTGADGLDHVYMHLRRPPPVRKGQEVATGQVVGAVGDTGRATGCHLHFELWSAPGWYSGGSVLDPMPLLRAWDRGT